MKHFSLFFTVFILLLPLLGTAQRNCASMEVLERQQAEDPELKSRIQAIEAQTAAFLASDRVQSRANITIPVVVHIVYRTSTENISDAQVQSQIEVLNADFRNLNLDKSSVPAEFAALVGNANIEFCLAKTDPQGNPTTGITRLQGTRTSWGTTDRVKKSTLGGEDPWDASKYLNLWVCNIGNGVLGYAQFPGGSATTDGVVIDYRYFGTMGTATAPFNKGRTATHEIGHWFNLRHIWGDTNCGDDLVSDTPLHDGANKGCPVYPSKSTCSGTPVEMTMNYMDYTDDGCMYMFSAGQAARMQAVLAPGGARYSLLSSNGCKTASGGGGITCNAPIGLNATNITASSATLNWSAVTGATAYNVQIRAVGATTWLTSTVSGTSATASNLTAGTAYQFQVQTVCGGTASSTFTLATFTTQQATTICADTYESNNTFSTAKTVPIGTPIKGNIASSSDEDWYKFTNTPTERNVRVRLSNLPADYDLRLYRGTTAVGISENNGTTDEEIVYNNSRSTTTYYVRVYSYYGQFNANNCYQLTATIAGSNLRDDTQTIELQPLAAAETLVVFPNPTSDELMLNIPVQTESPTQIYIFDMQGKLLITKSEALSKDNSITKLNVQQLPSGVYIVRVRSGNFVDNQKIIINR